MLKVSDLSQKLSLQLLAGKGGLEKEIKGCYVGDLLSWVMSKAKQNDVWVTVMGNINVAAVAVLTEVSAIILAEGSVPDKALIARANNEDIPIFSSKEPAAELVMRISKVL
jgi:serine kinase of HPr protein (carbohydrate metabolism regulator)